MTDLSTLTVSGVITATGGVVGDVVWGTGSGDPIGNVTGNLTGQRIEPTATAYAVNGALLVTGAYASLTKGSAGAYTLAVPGAGNEGRIMTVIAGSAQSHVLVVTGCVGGTTLTFTNVIGSTIQLLAVSATVWALLSNTGLASQAA
jgi:hypothetical protein